MSNSPSAPQQWLARERADCGDRRGVIGGVRARENQPGHGLAGSWPAYG